MADRGTWRRCRRSPSGHGIRHGRLSGALTHVVAVLSACVPIVSREQDHHTGKVASIRLDTRWGFKACAPAQGHLPRPPAAVAVSECSFYNIRCMVQPRCCKVCTVCLSYRPDAAHLGRHTGWGRLFGSPSMAVQCRPLPPAAPPLPRQTQIQPSQTARAHLKLLHAVCSHPRCKTF